MKLSAKTFLALAVFLMCASAYAKAGGTLAQGLSVPQRSKTQLTLTQKQKKHLTVRELRKLKREEQRRRKEAAAWLNAQQWRIKPAVLVPAKPSYSQCGFFMR